MQDQVLPQLKFRKGVADCWCNLEIKNTPKTGRKGSALQQEIEANKHRGNTQHVLQMKFELIKQDIDKSTKNAEQYARTLTAWILMILCMKNV